MAILIFTTIYGTTAWTATKYHWRLQSLKRDIGQQIWISEL